MKTAKSFSLIITAILMMQHVAAQNAIEEFTKISLPDRGKIILTQGSESSVRFENESSKVSSSFNVSDGTLSIHSNGNAEAYVTVREIKQIDISGSSSVEAQGTITVNELTLIISGIGKMEIPVKAEKIHADISGKGRIELSGSSTELNANISGAGKVDAEDLQVNRCNVTISGAGKTEVDVKDELNVEISGVGSVNYVTAPAKISKSISGIGKVGTASNDNKEKSEQDTTTVNVGNKKIIIIGDENDDDDDFHFDIDPDQDKQSTTVHYHKGEKVRGHWGGFELGFNNYGKSAFSTDLADGYDFLELNTGKSVAVNLNLFDWNAKILSYHLMFVTGLGITWNNWRFQNDRTLIPNAPAVSANFDSIDYSKNKLTVSYATLPLLLEFNSSEYEKKSFHVGAGIIFGYRIGSHTKQVYEENGKKRKVKTYDDFNLDTFRYDATLRIGFRGYTAFVSYGLGKLFKSKQGPELHPFTIGLAFVNW